jgi:glycine betaine/proline transport system substrate-binding protein
VGKLLTQLDFSAALEQAIMADMLGKRESARAAALRQLKAKPELVKAWLAGVLTRDGADGAAAVRARLARP